MCVAPLVQFTSSIVGVLYERIEHNVAVVFYSSRRELFMTVVVAAAEIRLRVVFYTTRRDGKHTRLVSLACLPSYFVSSIVSMSSRIIARRSSSAEE